MMVGNGVWRAGGWLAADGSLNWNMAACFVFALCRLIPKRTEEPQNGGGEMR